jgi:hypothetical protein
VVAALVVTAWLRHSRFGAGCRRCATTRTRRVPSASTPSPPSCGAITLSGVFMGAAGAFYVQVFQYIDPAIAFGAHVSVEALVGAIVGGMGTLWGPVLGALVLHALAEGTRNLFGQLPGPEPGDLRHGAGADRDVPAPRTGRAPAALRKKAAVAEPLLRVQGVSIAFGGLRAVQDVSLDVPPAR